MSRPAYSHLSAHREPDPPFDLFGTLLLEGGRYVLMEEHLDRIAQSKRQELLASGVPARDVASNLGVSIPTLFR